MIYFTAWKMESKDKIFVDFDKSLTEPQKQTYDKIKNERRQIYAKGYLLGFLLSFIAVVYHKMSTKPKMSASGLVCLVFVISFLTNYFYYILSPKTTYMVLHLNTKTQKEGWLKIYRAMQYNYHLGFVFGILALMFLSYGVTCKK
tara:strand:+ start:2248 stop:2682 length:435 start_codon:yes stop_codon:yes gene_type:complete